MNVKIIRGEGLNEVDFGATKVTDILMCDTLA